MAFACGLALFWSFMQYKTTTTQFIQRESELRLESILLELKEKSAHGEITRDDVVSVLRSNLGKRKNPLEDAIFYYLPPSGDERPIAVGAGTGKLAPPPLPWMG